MLVKPPDCKGCVLYGNGKGFILPEGYNTKKVFIVGEAAGQQEENTGKPFVKYAQAGSKLEEIFRLSGYQRDNFKILNVVNCRPPGNKLEYTPYETPAIEHCRVHLEKEIKPNGKNIIFTLGNVPFKALTGYSGIRKESITLMRGYIYETKYGRVVPSLHPSFLKRGKPSFTPYLIYDLAKAVKLSTMLNGCSNQYVETATEDERLYTHKEGDRLARANYNEFPSQQDILSFYYKVKDNPNLLLSYDIETPYSPELAEDERDSLDDKEITQIQFSLIKGQAIAFPFSNDYLPFIKLLFLTPNDKIGHNSFNFDNPRLRANNIKIKGTLHDSMWMFKHWQPALLRNLQSVASLFNYPMPWKHLFSSELRWYGCADVDSIQYIFPRLQELMKKEGIYQGYLDHVVNFFPILQDAANRGIPVNEERREELKGYLEKERIKIDDEIQKLVPDELKILGPIKKDKETKEIVNTGYSRTPAIIKQFWLNYSSIKRQWEDRNLRSEPYPIVFADYIKKQIQIVTDKQGKIKDRFIYKCIPKEITIEGVTHYKGRWHKQHYFKPSKEQLIKYIDWKRDSLLASNDLEDRRLARKYIVPVKFTKKDEPIRQTTGEKALRELLEHTYDDVIRLIIGDKDYESSTLINKVGIRSIDTNINNFIKNWKT
jgi:uracil-DNA glycosylase family 4